MSVHKPEPQRDAGLGQVRELEGRLDGVSAARAAAQARVLQARERAERILAEAQDRAETTTRRRRAAAVAEADEAERQVRLQSVEQAERLTAALEESPAAIGAFVELVLPHPWPRTGRR